jgi:hypothetical protein
VKASLDDGAADWGAPLYDDLLADMLPRRDPSAEEIAFLTRELPGCTIRVK